MRTTVALDDDLVRIAQEFTGVAEKTALLREALKALIERESARRLASLEGTMPKLKNIPVSYTHLDVYKRQLFMSFCDASEECQDRILRRSNQRFSITRYHPVCRKVSRPQTEQGERFAIA